MSRKQGPDGGMYNTATGKGESFDYGQGEVVSTGDRFDWGNVDSLLLQRAVDAVTSRGHSISFAVNYTHTSGSITILAGDQRPKWTGLSEQQAEERLKLLVGTP
jgi:hypothetical protein